MRILVLGASGFIGSNLILFAQKMGHEVIALCRSGGVPGFHGESYVWSLGQHIPGLALVGVDCVIHLAHDFGGVEGAELTRKGTISCIEDVSRAGISRQLFFSSYSAGAHALSLYGRVKQEIENTISKRDDVIIIRPGLVLGDGGIYGRIQKWARISPVIPLPNGGYGRVPIISIQNLCNETLRIVQEINPNLEANIFDRNQPTLRQLVLSAASNFGRTPYILPVPIYLIKIGFRIAKILRVSLPINEDNLNGFLGNQQATHKSTLQE